MIQSTIIKYLVIVLLVASLSAYVTHKITVNSFTTDALKTQNSEINAKDTIETKIAVVEHKSTEVTATQQQVKEVVRIKYQDVIKDNVIYVDKACSLPDDGIKLLNDTATQLNTTRK